jgi:uncharacterized protein
MEFAIAEELASRKINILLVARSEDLLKEVATEIATKYGVQTAYLAIDLAESNASQKIYDWCIINNYTVNILINNAGYGLSGALEKYSLQEHQAMMQVNMNVVVEMSYLFVEMLKRQSQSYIVNIASAAAYQSVPGLNVYAATKSFVLSFSRGLNYELKDTSVFVTVACPGATDTNFANRAKATGAKAQKLAKQFNMQPSDVAKIIVDGMFSKRTEIVVGFVNKLGVFLAWMLPKKLLEKSAASIYDL